jgi:hypothetical protein
VTRTWRVVIVGAGFGQRSRVGGGPATALPLSERLMLGRCCPAGRMAKAIARRCALSPLTRTLGEPPRSRATTPTQCLADSGRAGMDV